MNKLWIVIVTVLFSITCSAQLSNYKYKRKLSGTQNTWHSLTLPDSIYSRINENLSDIRVFAITETDTIETPYILQQNTGEVIHEKVPFNIINGTQGVNGFYYTFELEDNQLVNTINLTFNNKNFDWKIALEGSNDQKEWFGVLDDYRILSIKNEHTNYSFTTLKFSVSKFKYLRLLVKTKEKTELISASLTRNSLVEGTYKNYSIKKFSSLEVPKYKTTYVDIELPTIVPISQLTAHISNNFDYYRPFTIYKVTDSTKTDNTWSYITTTVYTGSLSSVDTTHFTFGNTLGNKFELEIRNHDNEPLTVESIQIKGTPYEMIIRCTQNATYYLAYGNPYVSHPTYDISNFKDKIPNNVNKLTLGNELKIDTKNDLKPEEKDFFNTYWLRGIMVVIILVLGFFTFKMLKEES